MADVSRKIIGEDGNRAVVLIRPVREYGPVTSIAPGFQALCEQSRITRFTPTICGKYVYNAYRCADVVYHKFASLHAYDTVVTIPDAVFSSMVVAYQEDKNPSSGNAAMRAKALGVTLSNTDCSMIFAVISVLTGDVTVGAASVACQREVVDAASYILGADEYNADGKPAARLIMRPLISGGAQFPIICPANSEASLKNRLVAYANKTQKTVGSLEHAADFATLIQLHFNSPNLQLATYEEVLANAKRPTQKVRLAKGENRSGGDPKDDDGDSRSIVKREVAVKAVKNDASGVPAYTLSDPRTIIISDEGIAFGGQSMMIKVYEVFKTSESYASGRPPIEIARMVRACAGNVDEFMLMNDFSRMDMCVSDLLRIMELLVYKGLFDEKHSQEIEDIHSTMFNRKIRTKGCGTYYQGFARGSGAADTGCGNWLVNVFCVYYAFRLAGYNQTDAFAKAIAGLYCGDDGLVPDLSVKHLDAAATTLGLHHKAYISEHGKPISFLSRYYGGGIYHGELNSFTDPVRAAVKLAYTTTAPGRFHDDTVLYWKALSYLVNDKHTPIIGPVCQTIVLWYESKYQSHEYLPEGTPEQLAVTSYHSLGVTPDSAYPNKEQAWMWRLTTEENPFFDLSAFEGYTPSDDIYSIPQGLFLGEPGPAKSDQLRGDEFYAATVSPISAPDADNDAAGPAGPDDRLTNIPMCVSDNCNNAAYDKDFIIWLDLSDVAEKHLPTLCPECRAKRRKRSAMAGGKSNKV
jgi:hypothetical protein